MVSLIASLPSVLAFCGLIVYLFTSQRRPPSPILLEILAIIRDRSGHVPKLDSRLSGREVARLLDRHPEFKQFLSEPILKILDDVRRSEERENIRVMIVLGGAVLLSLLIFALSVVPRKQPRPIDALYYKYDLTQPMTDENKQCFEIAAGLIDPYFTQYPEQQVVEKLDEAGVIAILKLGDKSPEAWRNYKFNFVRGKALWSALTNRISAASLSGGVCTVVSLIVFLTLTDDPQATPQSVLDGKSKVFWKFYLNNDPAQPPPGMQLEFDFAARTVRAWTPQIQADALGDGLKYWDDFAGKTLLVMPVLARGSTLNTLELFSKLGKEYPLPGYFSRRFSNSDAGIPDQDFFLIGPMK